MILIKDNHLAALKGNHPIPFEGGKASTRELPQPQNRSRSRHAGTSRQCPCRWRELILLDNMTPEQLRIAVDKCKGRAQTEASGGYPFPPCAPSWKRALISSPVGALTHSARAVDIGLDLS
jgi:nicotinate-nucleotide pyrophosphorylase (carboxylating)